MNYEWKIIPTTNGEYEATYCGKIRNKKTGRILKQSKSPKGRYKTVNLTKHGHIYVHRLVCMTFNGIPPTIKHEVNHIDSNKLNNTASNLEWITHKENIRHSLINRGYKINEDHQLNKKKYKSQMLTEIINFRASTEMKTDLLNWADHNSMNIGELCRFILNTFLEGNKNGKVRTNKRTSGGTRKSASRNKRGK